MLDYPYKKINHIRISGCIVRDATFRSENYAEFRLAHNVSSQAGTIFFNCRFYVYGGKKIPAEILKKGSKVIVEGSLDERKHERMIEVENVIANELRMTVLSNGEKKAALGRANSIELNGEICSRPYFGRNNVVVRFRISHEMDQLNKLIEDCVMFASDVNGKLPMALLQQENSVVIKGRFNLNTYRNPEGETEIIVEEISAAERIEKDIAPAEKATVPAEAVQEETTARTLPAAVPVTTQVIEEPELFSRNSTTCLAPEVNNASPRFICETVHF